VVRDFAKTIQEIIGENIETRTVFASKAARAKVDVARTNQVLLDLVLNARDAMSGLGTPTIEIGLNDRVVRDGIYPNAKPGRYVVLSVSNTGSGIDEKTIENIFEPFFTTYSVRREKGSRSQLFMGL
jgi:polar amino acid transport system substrate-binding protein